MTKVREVAPKKVAVGLRWAVDETKTATTYFRNKEDAETFAAEVNARAA